MTLAELYDMNSKLDADYLQAAYESVVNKMRLHAQAFPVKLTGACRIDGFEHKAELLNTSEIAFKHIATIDGVTLTTSMTDEYSLSTLVIGNEAGDGFGFTDFDDMNKGFETTPEIYWSGSDIVCTNLDECFFWITGYAYPYFVNAGDPYENISSYSIESMATSHGEDGLTVDPVLTYPVVFQALSSWFLNQNDIMTASQYDEMTVKVIEIYNKNPDWFVADIEEAYAQIEGLTL